MTASRVRIAKREWVWVLAWGVVYLALSSLPYVIGVLASTPEMQFGGFVYNVVDCNSYVAKMRQGARGEWLFTLPYTSEPHRGAFVYPYYIFLGKLGAWSRLSLILTYHLARLVCALLLMVSVYTFIARFTGWLAIRRLAFLLVFFSSGLGWLLLLLGLSPLFGDMPIDFWVPEGYFFLLCYATPHLAFAGALLFWLLALIVDAWRHGSWRRVAISAGVGLALTAILPFYSAVGYALLGTTWLVQSALGRRANGSAWWMLVVSGLPSLPMLGYQAYVFGLDPFFSAWAAQNVTQSPHIVHYLLGYAVPAVLAAGGVVWVVRRRDRQKVLLLVWAMLTPLLVYVPVRFQRRFLVGYQVPLALLAALGLARYVLLPFSRLSMARLLSRWPRYSLSGLRKWIVTALLALLAATNLIVVTGGSVEAWTQSPGMFHTRTELDMLDWLEANSAVEDVVLCAFDTGNFVPARTGNRVFLGHGPETVRSGEKEEMVARFYARSTPDAWRRSLLKEHRIAYVVLGPRERLLGDFDPAVAPYLVQAYANSDYQLLRVVLP